MARRTYKKKCQWCWKEFKTNYDIQKYCSDCVPQAHKVRMKQIQFMNWFKFPNLFYKGGRPKHDKRK